MTVITRKRRRHRTRLPMLIAAVLILGVAITGIVLAFKAPGKPAKGVDNVRNLEMPEWVTVELLPVNDYSRPGTKLKAVRNIVIHYVGNPATSAAQNRSFYENLAQTHETSASSNFLVGIDGEILECVPTDEVAYCSNGRNIDTISIECCHPDKTGKFTDATYQSLVKLTAYLSQAFGLDASDIIRHYDVTGKICPKYYVDHPDMWTAFKSDVQHALDALIKPSPSGR